jgi:sugar phosphate isomerase/epimerase
MLTRRDFFAGAALLPRRGPGVTLVEILEFAAKNKFDGFDPTGYFFPGYPAVPSDAYVDNFKKRAADLGVGISGTGVRKNPFAMPVCGTSRTGWRWLRGWARR